MAPPPPAPNQMPARRLTRPSPYRHLGPAPPLNPPILPPPSTRTRSPSRRSRSSSPAKSAPAHRGASPAKGKGKGKARAPSIGDGDNDQLPVKSDDKELSNSADAKQASSDNKRARTTASPEVQTTSAATVPVKKTTSRKKKSVEFGNKSYRYFQESDDETPSEDILTRHPPIKQHRKRPHDDEDYVYSDGSDDEDEYEAGEEEEEDDDGDAVAGPSAPRSPSSSSTAPLSGKRKNNNNPTLASNATPANAQKRASPSLGSPSASPFPLNTPVQHAPPQPTSPRPRVKPSGTQTSPARHRSSEDSTSASSSSPRKRQRTDDAGRSSVSPDPEDAMPEEEDAAMDEDNHWEIDHADELFEELVQEPRALALDEVSALFVRMQEMCFRFSQQYFSFRLRPRQEQSWPLHLLSTRYRSLMLVTQFIADGSQHTWRNFFTKPEHRRHLVNGILGEWFNQRIFKHTAFGVPKTIVEEFEAIDHEFIHYDAFVRSKKRAQCLAEYFSKANRLKNGKHAQHLAQASTKLANELMTVIHPLLPMPLYNPIRGEKTPRFRDKNAADSIQHAIFMGLVDLIKKMAALHLSIRLTGANGTIVRIASHVAKGSRFEGSEADHNICLNAQWCNTNRPVSLTPNDSLQVKMTCWGRVEAVVPQGPDQLELEQAQHRYSAARSRGEEPSWEQLQEDLFPAYPYDLQTTHAGRAAVANDQPLPGTEWNIAFAKAGLDERYRLDETEDEDGDENGRGSGDNSSAGPARGPFVTIYPRVAPSNVYCEWVRSSPTTHRAPGASGSIQQGEQKKLSLAQAIAHARRNASIYYRLQDAYIETRNSLRQYRFHEWFFLGCIVVGGGAAFPLILEGAKRLGIDGKLIQLNHELLKRELLQLQDGVHVLKASGEDLVAALRGGASSLAFLMPALPLPLPQQQQVGQSTITLTSTITEWTVVTAPWDGVCPMPTPADSGSAVVATTPAAAAELDSNMDLDSDLDSDLDEDPYATPSAPEPLDDEEPAPPSSETAKEGLWATMMRMPW